MTILDLLRAGIHDGSDVEPGHRVWLAAVGMAVFALLWAVVEWLGARAGVPGAQVVWIRYGTHLLLLAALFGRSAGSGLVRTPRPALHVVRSFTMLGMPLSFIAALRYLSMREVEAVFWSGIAAFCCLRILQTRGTDLLLSILSPLLALSGAWQLLGPFDIPMRPVLIFPLASAGCFVLYLILTRAMTGESEISKLFHTALWVFASLSFIVPFGWRTPSPIGWVAAVAIGVLGCGALFALDIAVRLASPVRVAAVSFLQLVFSVGGTAILGRGRISGQLLSGGACIILGGLMGLVPAKRFRTGTVS